MKAKFTLKHLPGQHNQQNHAGTDPTMRQQDYTASLDSNEVDAVKDYTIRNFRNINNGLRSGGESKHQTLDNVVANAPYTTVKTVYRALAKTPEELGWKVGDIIEDKAYMSTSSDVRYMYTKLSSLTTRMTIKVPKETRALHIAPSMTAKKDEKEILFPRNTKIRIKSIRQNESYWDIMAEIVS